MIDSCFVVLLVVLRLRLANRHLLALEHLIGEDLIVGLLHALFAPAFVLAHEVFLMVITSGVLVLLEPIENQVLLLGFLILDLSLGFLANGYSDTQTDEL